MGIGAFIRIGCAECFTSVAFHANFKAFAVLCFDTFDTNILHASCQSSGTVVVRLALFRFFSGGTAAGDAESEGEDGQ